jgi:hypothetical protein
MILQFAHHLALAMQERFGDVAVYANSSVSLNGREPEPLIDPKVDLVKVQRSLAHSTWILPLQGKLRKPQAPHEEQGIHHHHVTGE